MKNPAWTVVCDFDGTITPVDVTDELFARFARPEWMKLEAQWLAGRIDSRACMAGQVALLDCSREELDDFLTSVEIDPCFAQFAATVAALGWQLVVVSDGIDHVCRSILQRYDLGRLPIFANRLVQVTDRRWVLDFPYARAGCAAGHCKCDHAIEVAKAGPVLLIGDGMSDFCVARQADFVFARGRLREHCEASGIAFEVVEDFARATRLLARLSHRAPTATVTALFR